MSIKISVVAPSSANLDDQTISEALNNLKNQGFDLKVKEGFISRINPLHSNEDEYRAAHLYEELCSDDSEYLWCLKGGYGGGRLIPLLEKMEKPSRQKTIIGFSDVTALHIFLTQKWGMKCIHGATVSNGVKKEFSIDNFNEIVKLINEKELNVELNDITRLNDIAPANIEGEMIGGNLCIIDSSMGTSWQINADNKILFLEDVDERGYQVDRMLEHMRQVGIFEKVKAILFGQFTGGKEKDGSDNKEFALKRFSKSINKPIYKTESIGHGFINRPFLQNGKITISGNHYKSLIN